MHMDQLKYSNYDVVFQEVPGEVTLAINITQCPHQCKGCHSAALADDFGKFLNDDIDEILNQYSRLVTCVCFMGGDQHMADLLTQLKKVKSKGLKTCVYSGADDINVFCEAIDNLDYLKIGYYDEELGGLSSSKTNQRFYKIEEDGQLQDMTDIFWR